MAKPPTKIPLPCGACSGKGSTVQEVKGVYDKKTGRVETTYRTVSCGACQGKGFINR